MSPSGSIAEFNNVVVSPAHKKGTGSSVNTGELFSNKGGEI